MDEFHLLISLIDRLAMVTERLSCTRGLCELPIAKRVRGHGPVRLDMQQGPGRIGLGTYHRLATSHPGLFVGLFENYNGDAVQHVAFYNARFMPAGKPMREKSAAMFTVGRCVHS